MGRTACTEPQCLYNGALYIYPLILALRVISSDSNCVSTVVMRVRLYFNYISTTYLDIYLWLQGNS